MASIVVVVVVVVVLVVVVVVVLKPTLSLFWKVLEWHPDKHTGDDVQKAARMFNKIKLANVILSDAFKRGQLDAGGVTVGDIAADTTASNWDRDHDYYAEHCPPGCQRVSDVGQRRWNPRQKVSKTFECNPCRMDPHVLERDNKIAAASKKTILLKNNGGARLQDMSKKRVTDGK